MRSPRSCCMTSACHAPSGPWFAGAMLGLAGAIAQGIFRNPLAEPYLLGTASGAALGVTISLITVDASIGSLAWAGKFGITAAASLGAGVATALTLALSRGVVQTSRLLLSGIVVGFLLSAVTSLLLLARPETWRTMQVFLLGSTGYLGWSSTLLLAVIFGACLVPATLLSRGLDALTLGDDTAASLGLSLPALRLSLLAVLSIATAAVVGQVGLIGVCRAGGSPPGCAKRSPSTTGSCCSPRPSVEARCCRQRT